SGAVGEIWVSGPSVARGYWRREQETDAAFRAVIRETGEGPFLRSGDLGFLRDSELFVTGRLKELMVIGGRNYYPVDIEQACEGAVPALKPNCGAAFMIDSGGDERLAIVYEVSEDPGCDYDAILASVRAAVTRAVGLRVHGAALVRPRTIPKTSSGKVQRWMTREK